MTTAKVVKSSVSWLSDLSTKIMATSTTIVATSPDHKEAEDALPLSYKIFTAVPWNMKREMIAYMGLPGKGQLDDFFNAMTMYPSREAQHKIYDGGVGTDSYVIDLPPNVFDNILQALCMPPAEAKKLALWINNTEWRGAAGPAANDDVCAPLSKMTIVKEGGYVSSPSRRPGVKVFHKGPVHPSPGVKVMTSFITVAGYTVKGKLEKVPENLAIETNRVTADILMCMCTKFSMRLNTLTEAVSRNYRDGLYGKHLPNDMKEVLSYGIVLRLQNTGQPAEQITCFPCNSAALTVMSACTTE